MRILETRLASLDDGPSGSDGAGGAFVPRP